MADTQTEHEDRKTTQTTTQHHRISTIASPGTYTETAPKHHHQGTRHEGSTVFEGGLIAASSVVDHVRQQTTQTSSTFWGKSGIITTSTQTPINISQPIYRGHTVLAVDNYVGEGPVFQGVLEDNTARLELNPVITTAFSRMEKNSRWLGTTSGLKVDQGQEQVIPAQIQGRLLAAHPGVLKLTSTILDLADSKIDKKIHTDIYQPRVWNHQEVTGNVQFIAPAVGIAVGLAVTIATGGAGSQMMSFLQNALLEEMATAAFITLCASTASSFVTHQGDLGQVTKDLFQAETLKNVALAAGTVAVMRGLFDKFPSLAKVGGLEERFLQGMVRSSVQLHLDIALNGGNYKSLAKNYALHGAVGAMSGYFAQGIGDLLSSGEIDALSHKLLHGALGAVSTTLTGDGPMAGALGAMVAETVAETVFEAKLPALEGKYTQRLEKSHKSNER